MLISIIGHFSVRADGNQSRSSQRFAETFLLLLRSILFIFFWPSQSAKVCLLHSYLAVTNLFHLTAHSLVPLSLLCWQLQFYANHRLREFVYFVFFFIDWSRTYFEFARAPSLSLVHSAP
jgi:hypothetical protein